MTADSRIRRGEKMRVHAERDLEGSICDIVAAKREITCLCVIVYD